MGRNLTRKLRQINEQRKREEKEVVKRHNKTRAAYNRQKKAIYDKTIAESKKLDRMISAFDAQPSAEKLKKIRAFHLAANGSFDRKLKAWADKEYSAVISKNVQDYNRAYTTWERKVCAAMRYTLKH